VRQLQTANTTSLGLPPANFDSPVEVWPNTYSPIITNESEQLFLREASFGLVPHWAHSLSYSKSNASMNALSETVAALPSFRSAWRQQQFALVPVEAIFEPYYETGTAVRQRIERTDHAPFTIAGIWDIWEDDVIGSHVRTFTMLTVNSATHPLMSRMHKPDDEKRSIVVIPQTDWHAWLHATERDARELLNLFPADDYMATPDPLPPRAKKASTISRR